MGADCERCGRTLSEATETIIRLGESVLREQARADAAERERERERVGYQQCVEMLRTQLSDAEATIATLREALRDASRSFESIQIRCREGSKKTDWLPTIDHIATDARTRLLALSPPQTNPQEPEGSSK